MNRIWWDIASITAVGYLARGSLGRLFSLPWENTRRVWISGTRQRSSTTSLRPMIRPIVSRARAASWSSYQSDLRRHRRLQEACASILYTKTCLRLSVGSPEQRLVPCAIVPNPPTIRLTEGGPTRWNQRIRKKIHAIFYSARLVNNLWHQEATERLAMTL